jgi:Metal-dependent hydrolases of the beta-lactamase superfamily III
LPTSERYPSAHVLNAHERFFLIDCGEGTQMQLRKHRIRFSKINNIFISHLHGDHVFGLYGLLSTFSLMGRKSPLRLYAPQNYHNILLSHLMDFDIHLSFEIDFIPLAGKSPAVILDDKYITVSSFPLKHRVPCFGFLFREKDLERNVIRESISRYSIPTVRIPSIKKGADYITPEGMIIRNEDITIPPRKPLSYAYCSDTRYFRQLPSFVKGVTLLYHETTFDKTLDSLAETTGHSTTLDAARTAVEAQAESLIIGHFSARYKNIFPLVEEAKTIFRNTFPAIDGKSYDVGGL